MSRSNTSLDQLFDRSWRPGHPFRPRLSPARRWGMLALLLFLATVIATYGFLTDGNRVRRMCESYLSQLSGGEVTVQHAALSIFEGLRLDGVSVRVDKTDAYDSTLFEAQSVLIKYNPESIFNGKLEATQIVAIDPRVRLCENVDTKKWNYQRMTPPKQPGNSSPRRVPTLPEINLRNGVVDYSQIQNGKVTSLGSMSLDGTLVPAMAMGRYRFGLQSRSVSDGLGPAVTGEFSPGTGEVDAKLENFEFGRDIKAMLPEQVRRFWEDHNLAGRVNVPVFHIKSQENKDNPIFHVETELEDVVLSVQPGEWLGAAETNRFSTLHGAFDLMRTVGLNGQRRTSLPIGHHGFVDRLETCVAPTPIELDVSRGTFIFTQDGIELKQVKGAVEGNKFILNGQISGYSPSAPAEITIEGRDIQIPDNPRYINSLPREVREFYEHMHPSGKGNLWAKVLRPRLGGRPEFVGGINIEEGQFRLDQFPYPLRKIRGQVTFGPDPVKGTRLDINLAGLGAAGGANQDKSLFINGWIAPLDPDGEFFIRATAENVVSERLVRAALPTEAREALDHLDPSGRGDYPEFRGDLTVDLTRVPGPNKPLNAVITLDLADAKGAYEAFPYLLDHVTGKVIIAPGSVKIVNAKGQHGDATMGIDGEITFGRNKPLVPNVHVTGRNMKIDQELLAAMQPEQREWVQKLGIGGKVDVDGDVFRKPGASTQPSTRPGSDIDVTLDIALHEGTVWPRGSMFTLTDVEGKIRSADHQLRLTQFTGRRDDATLRGEGVITLGDEPRLSLRANATNLKLDSALYGLLPADGRSAWDSVQPQGTLDVALKYESRPPTTRPTVISPAATTAPVEFYGTDLTLQPRKLSATFKGVPYRLDNVAGTIFVKNDLIVLKDLSARHGAAQIALSGTGNNAGRAKWELSLSGRDLPADDDLKRALPPAITNLLDSTQLHGKVSFDFTTLNYTGAEPSTLASGTTNPTTTGTTKPSDDGDMDIAGNLWLIGSSLDIGVPLTEVQALVALDAHVRKGRLAGLKGAVDASTLKVADRPAANLHAEMFKPADQDAMRIDKLRLTLAGGELAGQIDVAFPQAASSRFALALVLRNADVKQLAGEKENVKGQLTASLALEGAWGDLTTRRGRGDVSVAGRDMYRIPLMLGLMQVTNLALPISSPFSEANARYLVDGQKVTFETIEMRASNMVMQGSGSLDFGTKKVKMTFVTDNPNWPKLPLVNDLIAGARHELLQIQVSGTVQEPKVKGAMLNTFSTTVDEVFRSGDSAAEKRRK